MPGDTTLREDQAALWFLGQAGYLARGAGVTVVIDPYLSDSVREVALDCARLLPVPVAPEDLRADLFLVTHDHLDHLDPATVGPYRHKERTWFVAPRLACRKLAALGVPEARIRRVDVGGSATLEGVQVRGMFALPTDDSVADTVGYRVEFPNGRSFYHCGDTGFCERLLDSAPRAEVLLACINGKWGNLDVAQAVRLALAVAPRTAIPNHYDMMAPNTADPAAFVAALAAAAPGTASAILEVLRPFVWGRPS